MAESKSARLGTNLDLQDIPTCTKRPAGQNLTILDLPVEIIFNIVDEIFNLYPEDLWRGYGKPWTHWVAELGYLGVRNWPHFDVWRDVIRLMYTCKTLYNAIWPVLYQKDAIYNESSALILSAMKGNSAGVAKSLMKGGDVFAAYREFDDEEYFAHDDPWMCSGTTERTTVWHHEVSAVHWAAFNRDLQSLRYIDDNAFIDFGQSTVDSFTADNRLICQSLDAVLNQFEPTINQLQVPSSQAWDRSRMINYLKSILKKGPNVFYFALINVSAKKYQENWVSTSSKDTIEMLVEALRLEHWISNNFRGTFDVLVDPDVSLITHLGTKLHALHQACGGRDVDTSRFILNETTTSVDIRDAFDNTPMHHVAMCKRSEEDTDDPLTTDPRSIIQLLLEHGADINAGNTAGHTPLQECFIPPGYPNVDVAVVLLYEGARTPASLDDLIEGVDIKYEDEQKLADAWPMSIGSPSSSTSLETLDTDRHEKSTNWLYKLTCCTKYLDGVDYSKFEANKPKSWSQWYAWLADSPSEYGDPFVPK
ncbi:hypothetical protein CGCSCA4_v010809 [Colletotrichum siamense]|uniref:Ankyrin repeat protein n=1 Tax=Colletotrichum siamense TaxID=690259 RepID=A0A9P5ES34_COLSI|nr:hypothetical protein CGCSCA4_v010809 [Colletotrichum siamense]KAF4858568.1 hypothetical protein CGCSCA2_v007208 [Colletotrichum siamense]